MNDVTFGQAVWTIILGGLIILGPLAVGVVLYRAGFHADRDS